MNKVYKLFSNILNKLYKYEKLYYYKFVIT